MSNDIIVQLSDVTKEYGDTTAVRELSFAVEEGEFFSLLGPSGCGKSTTLRAVAGFEQPTAGAVEIAGVDVAGVPADERDTGMVFQGYALFPHKTVGENVGFGLKMAGVSADERDARVAEMLATVDLAGYEDRTPSELSGGQQQRVALARALVIEPSVLLLDEPLAALDRKLRQELRRELKRIQEDLGITTIYVTHDQEEALSMSDRILVMNDGESQQVASPRTLYRRPANEFVAEFIGDTNLLPASPVDVEDGTARFDLDVDGAAPVVTPADRLGEAADGWSPTGDVDGRADLLLNIRPEDLMIVDDVDRNVLEGEALTTTFVGKTTQVVVDVGDGTELVAEVSPTGQAPPVEPGETVRLGWESVDCTVVVRGDR
ncbi:MAG: ABC transporter ATP-binding protein [Halolamina sp.]